MCEKSLLTCDLVSGLLALAADAIFLRSPLTETAIMSGVHVVYDILMESLQMELQR